MRLKSTARSLSESALRLRLNICAQLVYAQRLSACLKKLKQHNALPARSLALSA
jgi:hypothetical protein